jgi:UDP-N-acetyl-D-mannosaminuronic acid dehydrogenase
MLINEGLPNFIVENIRKSGVNLARANVGILGMAFKADSDDIRDSLSFKLAKILRFHGATVLCSDEYVWDASFVTKEHVLATCPIVIIGAPHRAYYDMCVPASTCLIDLWDIVPSYATAWQGGVEHDRAS